MHTAAHESTVLLRALGLRKDRRPRRAVVPTATQRTVKPRGRAGQEVTQRDAGVPGRVVPARLGSVGVGHRRSAATANAAPRTLKARRWMTAWLSGTPPNAVRTTKSTVTKVT